MTRAKPCICFLSVNNYTQELRICYTGMSIMLQSPTFPVYFKTYTSMSIVIIYAFGVSEVCTQKSLDKHQSICTREDFMSVVHLLPAAESEQAHIKFEQDPNTYHAPFVIYADFESILVSIIRRVKQNIYNQQHKILAACAMLVSNVPAVPTQAWLSIGENALSEFLDTLIDWEQVCIKHLKTMSR